MLSLTPRPFTHKPCSFSWARSLHRHSSHPGPVPSLAACLCPCPPCLCSVLPRLGWSFCSSIQGPPVGSPLTQSQSHSPPSGGRGPGWSPLLSFIYSGLPGPSFRCTPASGPWPVLPSVGESFPRGVSCAGLPVWSPSGLLRCHLPIVTLPEDRCLPLPCHFPRLV